MTTMKLSSLIVSGILLSSAASMTFADEGNRYSRQELEQQRNEVRIYNQGEDSQIRNRFKDSSGKGDMIRQRKMDGGFSNGLYGKNMAGSKKGKY